MDVIGMTQTVELDEESRKFLQKEALTSSDTTETAATESSHMSRKLIQSIQAEPGPISSRHICMQRQTQMSTRNKTRWKTEQMRSMRTTHKPE